MTTQFDYSQKPSFSIIDLTPISSDSDEDWQHLVLEMFRPKLAEPSPKKSPLYLVASTFGEEYDAEFAPKPKSAKQLPVTGLQYTAADESGVRTTGEVSRNAPCPCGSGKKYKRCHGGAA